MSLKRRVSKVVKGSSLYLGLAWHLDRLQDRSASGGRPSNGYHVLLAATGNGNIGDQAMFEAFLENVRGDVHVICESATFLLVPAQDRDRVVIHPMPRLIRGVPLLRTLELRRLHRILREATSFSVTGADLMDGLYSPAASVARVSALLSARAHQVPTRVLGFSWSDSPHPAARRALRHLGTTTRLFARDPRSQARLIADGIGGVEGSADTVFAAQTVDTTIHTDWVASKAESGRRVALVNASALIGQRMEQVTEYVTILRELLGRGYCVVMLPHVLRAFDDDLSEVRRIVGAIEPSDDLLVVDHALTPAQIRGLARTADVVITGRMHLAIMSLMANKRPITLSTQGKVEGLYDLFGGESLAVEPRPGFAAEVIARLDSAQATDPEAAVKLASVIQRARLNFEGL